MSQRTVSCPRFPRRIRAISAHAWSALSGLPDFTEIAEVRWVSPHSPGSNTGCFADPGSPRRAARRPAYDETFSRFPRPAPPTENTMRMRDLLDTFVGESVAARPIGALWARLALRIINAFLMRASENAIRNHYRAYLVSTEKIGDLLTNEGVVTNVGTFGEPALEQIGLAAFTPDDGYSDFCSQIRSRSVEGDRGERIASESAPNALRQPGGRTLDLLHVFMKHLSLR